MGFFTKRAPKFSGAISKKQFVDEWVADVLLEAGCGLQPGQVEQMTQMAVDGIVRQALVSVVEGFSDAQIASHLKELDRDDLVFRLDAIYARTVELATVGLSGPGLRARLGEFDSVLDRTFVEIRPNYVNYARINFS